MKRRDLVLSSVCAALATPVLALSPPVLFMPALDISGSMYPDGPAISIVDHELQRRGHVTAFRNAEIQDALLWIKPILSPVVWSGENSARELIAGGVHIKSRADIDFVAGVIERDTPRAPSSSKATWHDGLMQFVLDVSAARGHGRYVVDISTDERPSAPLECKRLRSKIQAAGGTINVVAIDATEKSDLVEDHQNFVQTPDGFSLQVRWADEYVPILQRKILQEMTFV